MTSQSLRLSAVSARAIDAAAAGPCTVTGTCETRKPKPDPRSCPRKSRQPSVSRLATSPTWRGTSGTGSACVSPQQALRLERAQEQRPLGGETAQQRGDVDLGEDEADLALGPVEVERAAQDHHHALGELDALLGQAVAQRRPGTAPALHVQRRHAAAATVPPRPVVLGIDQAQDRDGPSDGPRRAGSRPGPRGGGSGERPG